MSSEIYELMKRSDEAHVVEKAHRRPRFVEDCVREMIRGVVERFPELDDRAFVSARQVNLETIHQHNVVAERFGTLGEIRHELATGDRRTEPHEPPRLARSGCPEAPARRSAIEQPASQPEEVVGSRQHRDDDGHVDQNRRATPGARGRRSARSPSRPGRRS